MATQRVTEPGIEESEEEYEPYAHREVQKPTNYFESLVLFIKGCFGTGILALPEAFKYSGILNGTASTLIIGFICTYCLHLLVKTEYELCRRLKVGSMSYQEAMRAAFEMGPSCFRKCRWIYGVTASFLVAYQLGVCTTYVVFVADNIKLVVEYYIPQRIALAYYILMMFLPCVLIMCLRNLKILAPFSLFADIVTLLTFGVIFYYICRNLQPFSSLSRWGTLYTYPLFFGTAIFGIQAIGVVTTVEANMKDPKKSRGLFGVINVAMFIVTITSCLIAALGYWRYGDDIKPSITLNFPVDDWLGQFIRILYCLAVYVSYGLNCYVAFYIIWYSYIEHRLENSRKKVFWEYMVRSGCVIFTFIVAIGVPYLGLIISLVGAFCLSMLVIAFPAVMEICVLWPDKFGPGKIWLYKNMFLILLAILGLLSGCYSSISEIIQKHRHEKEG